MDSIKNLIHSRHDEPSHDESSPDKPSHDEPSHDERSHNEPNDDEPSEDESSEDEPSEDESSEDVPTENEPSEDEPSEDESNEDEQSDDEYSDGDFRNDESNDDESSNDEPSEIEPSDDEPSHEESHHDVAKKERQQKLEDDELIQLANKRLTQIACARRSEVISPIIWRLIKILEKIIINLPKNEKKCQYDDCIQLLKKVLSQKEGAERLGDSIKTFVKRTAKLVTYDLFQELQNTIQIPSSSGWWQSQEYD